jgi:Zn-dependent peptidase ImmA (M78 family)
MVWRRISESRREFIAELAEDVWKSHSSDGRLQLPAVAESIDVEITYDDFGEDFDGVLEHRAGEFHVFVNTRRNPRTSARARFTLAHEYGHYFIDEHRNALAAGRPPYTSFTDQPAKNPVELEANIFASHLLMPSRQFNAALAKSPQSVAGICKLATDFHVSVQSAALRYVAGSDKPCAVIMFRNGSNPWWEVSPQMEAMRLTFMKPLNIGSLKNCASAAAHKDSFDRQSVHHEAEAFAGSWFKGIGNRWQKSAILKETAIRLGEWGVLTLLVAT